MGRVLRRSCVALAAVLGCIATRARADAPSWLGWSAPTECQNTSEVERRLASLLGHSIDVAALPPTLVRMGWSAERGWSVRVTVQLDAGPRDRSLDAPSCADALDVIALSLALLLEPGLDLDAAGSAAAAPEAAGASEPPVLIAELEPPMASSPTPDVPAGAERASGAGAGSDGALEIGSLRPLRLIAGGGPLTDLGIFPVPQFGGGVHVGLARGSIRLELEGSLLASESTRFTGAEYPVSFHSYFGALRGCYTLGISSRFGWVGCAGGELGSLGTHEAGGEEHRARGLWLAAEASTGPEFAATSWLRAFARVRAASPLIRHEFLLTEGTRVHDLPWLSPQLQVGIEMDVTDLGGGAH